MASLAALTDSSVFPWVALAFGLCIGSFLNVVIHRLPRMMEREWREQCAELAGSGDVGGHAVAEAGHGAAKGAHRAAKPAPRERYNLVVPRSACPKCGHKITALENIPLLSYAVLRGKCSSCRTPIGLRYPVVELAAGVAGAYAASRFGFSAAGFGAMLFAWALIALAIIDFDTQLLPDDLTLPLLWAGLLFNYSGTFVTLGSAVIGAAAGYLSLWSVYWLFKLVTGKEGMGYGDFKLLAAICAWLGWQALALVILLSSVVGAVVGIGLMALRRHGRDKPIPFGPYLAAAGFIALFWGDAISRKYLPLLT
jgi:leader peptidase (prepilin peptidase) / N-methyltransferase